MQTTSIINTIMHVTKSEEPQVGMGATVLAWTDRYAGTIVEVKHTQAGKVKEVVVQEDKATRTDGFGMSDSQTYAYEADPQGRLFSIYYFKGEVSKRSGYGLAVGIRRKYHDFSF